MSNSQAKLILPELTIPPNSAIEKIKGQIASGEIIAALNANSFEIFVPKLKDAESWSGVNYELFHKIFADTTVAIAYDNIARFRQSAEGTWVDEGKRLTLEIKEAISFLKGILGRINILNDPDKPASVNTNPIYHDVRSLDKRGENKIFIVHGHDVAVKETVARFITQLGLEPIILHEQPNEGNTIIEKFEKNADVYFAVVLLTPDDIGYPTGKSEASKSRARQNVVFELGYFISRLGRRRVCALHKGEIEIPSDYHGIIYVPLDDSGAWKLSLARDMKSAGIDIDLNKAL